MGESRVRPKTPLFLGLETAGGVGVFHAKGWWSKSWSLLALGSEGRELGMSWEFCWDVPDPGGVQKLMQQKNEVRAHLLAPIQTPSSP